MKVEVYKGAPFLTQNTEVVNVNFDLDVLTVNVDVFDSDTDVIVKFSDIVGFRALDERDLSELWVDLNKIDAWIFEVKSGGWLDLESTRQGFLTQYNHSQKEFFISGMNLCVSVITYSKPVIQKIAST